MKREEMSRNSAMGGEKKHHNCIESKREMWSLEPPSFGSIPHTEIHFDVNAEI